MAETLTKRATIIESKTNSASVGGEDGVLASEIRYRRLFESSRDGILILDADTRKIIDVNPFMIELLGYSHDEFIGKELWELGLLRDEEASKCAFTELQGVGYIRYGDLRLETDLGRRCEVEFISNVYDEGDRQVIQCNIRDITGRKAAENELEKLSDDLEVAAEDYRRVLDNSLDVICQMDKAGKFLKVSPAAKRVWDYEPEELIGTMYWDLVHPDDLVKTHHAAGNTLAGKPTSTFENRTMRKDGSVANMMWSGNWSEPHQTMYCVARDVSEIRLAETALEESDTNYRALIESLPAIVCLSQPFQPYASIYISPNVAVFGYSVEEWAGRPDMWISLIHADDRERVLSEALEAMKCDPETELEYRMVTPDGQTHWMRDKGQLIPDREGVVTGWQRIIMDVSSGKEAEIAIRHSRDWLDAIVEGSRDSILVEENDHIIFANKALADTYGYESADEMIGKHISTFRSAEDDQRMLGYSKKRLAGENVPTTYEFKGVRRDGSVFDADVSVSAFRSDGKSFIVSSPRDVTERKLAEEKVKKSEELYRDLVENAYDMIYTRDMDGNNTSINAAGEKLTGFSREEFLQRNMSQIVVPEHLDLAKEKIAQKLAGNEGSSYETDILAKDGRRITLEVNTRLIFRDGVAVGVQGIARDITARKNLEEQLLQSQKLESVGRLAGGIAHDFNNMLTAINGYSDLTLRRMKDDDPLRHDIEEIKKAGSRSAELTYQLLAFSRQQILQPQVVKLNQVIIDTSTMLQRLIGEDIQLINILSPKTGQVKIDPGQLSQIIMNLAVNARDAMPQGGKLTFETGNVFLDEDYARQHVNVLPGAYIKLGVSDNGSGMDAETQLRIFEPFFSTKEIGKGTGLGLATVYGIVKQSGGNITVYSEAGVGTTFKIYLPRVIDKSEVVEAGEPTVELPTGTETILLVEDEEMVRALTRQILEMCGYTVLEAENGREALTLCESHVGRIDLLMTDVVMPEMGGRELAETILRSCPQMQVLFASGYTDDAVVRHGVIDASTNFIQKPYGTDELAQKVRGILDAAENTGH